MDLSLKTCLLLAMNSAERLGELCDFSIEVNHSESCNLCTFSSFQVHRKNAKPYSARDVHRGILSTVLLFQNFTGVDEAEILLFSERAMKHTSEE